MGILLFSVLLGWLPTSGYVPPGEGILACIRSLTLPALSLAVFQIGLLARMTRATTLEVLRQDFVRTARAKGVHEWRTVAKHALANELGRASLRERGCPYGLFSGVAVSLKKKNKNK